jgi:hypothetical protein
MTRIHRCQFNLNWRTLSIRHERRNSVSHPLILLQQKYGLKSVQKKEAFIRFQRLLAHLLGSSDNQIILNICGNERNSRPQNSFSTRARVFRTTYKTQSEQKTKTIMPPHNLYSNFQKGATQPRCLRQINKVAFVASNWSSVINATFSHGSRCDEFSRFFVDSTLKIWGENATGPTDLQSTR